MVESILTQEMIKAGAALVEKLDEREFQPVAALWFYFPDTEKWKLVIAESEVVEMGPREVYLKIRQILDEHSDEIAGISLADVSLAKPDARIIDLLRIAIQTGPGISGIRFKGNTINGILIEDAYIYRLL